VSELLSAELNKAPQNSCKKRHIVANLEKKIYEDKISIIEESIFGSNHILD
jgi:hypothetical protein